MTKTEEWKKYTRYERRTEESQTIRWFDVEKHANVLKFATILLMEPVGGFGTPDGGPA